MVNSLHNSSRRPPITVGDIHGDLPKAIRALEVAGVLGEQDGRPLWTGGDTTIVQLGDVLDRGDCEIGTWGSSCDGRHHVVHYAPHVLC